MLMMEKTPPPTVMLVRTVSGAKMKMTFLQAVGTVQHAHQATSVTKKELLTWEITLVHLGIIAQDGRVQIPPSVQRELTSHTSE